MRSFFALAGTAALLVALGCSDPNPLPKPSIPNGVDTLGLYAISGTEVWQPSAYSTSERRIVRLDQSATVDFAYQITPDGRHVLLPGALVGQPAASGVDPGMRVVTDSTFDQLVYAPNSGYLTRDTIPVQEGTLFYLKGRVGLLCYFGYPTYGKVEILRFEEEERVVWFRILANFNCGYRSLEPGLPTR